MKEAASAEVESFLILHLLINYIAALKSTNNKINTKSNTSSSTWLLPHLLMQIAQADFPGWRYNHIFPSVTSTMQHFPGCISTTPYDVLLCACMTYNTWPVWHVYLPITNRMHVNLSRTCLSHNLLNYRVIHGITDSVCINGSTVTARCTGLCINIVK